MSMDCCRKAKDDGAFSLAVSAGAFVALSAAAGTAAATVVPRYATPPNRKPPPC
jgi:hypothetical protein